MGQYEPNGIGEMRKKKERNMKTKRMLCGVHTNISHLVHAHRRAVNGFFGVVRFSENAGETQTELPSQYNEPCTLYAKR